jgi:hypothetical protein
MWAKAKLSAGKSRKTGNIVVYSFISSSRKIIKIFVAIVKTERKFVVLIYSGAYILTGRYLSE